MGRFLMRLEDARGPVYFEWSTIVDAPVSHGLNSEDDLRCYLSPKDATQDRFDRLREKGTSSLVHDSAEEVIAFNRAGPNESCATKEEIMAMLREPWDDPLCPTGER